MRGLRNQSGTSRIFAEVLSKAHIDLAGVGHIMF